MQTSMRRRDIVRTSLTGGMLPFLIKEGELSFKNLDYIYILGIRKAVEEKVDVIKAYAVGKDKKVEFEMT